MQTLNYNFTQNSTQASTDNRNSHQDTPRIDTLENLIQTLEEVANYLASK